MSAWHGCRRPISMIATLVLIAACTAQPAADQSLPFRALERAPMRSGSNSTSGTFGVVEGRVLDAAGQPVAEVQILTRPVSDVAELVPEHLPFTDARGAYRWELPAGWIEVTAYKAGFSPIVQLVEVVPGRTIQLDFTIAPLP